MFKNGEWVRWDGSDVQSLIVEEKITLNEFIKRYPDQYRLIKELKTRDHA